MMDREFDVLSNEIEEYSKTVQAKTKESDFDIEIDTELLSQYVLTKFESNEHIETTITGSVVNKSAIEELTRFGFTKIDDIDQKLTKEVIEKLMPEGGTTTYIRIIKGFNDAIRCR